MRVLLQAEHPRHEKSPTTRHAPNDLAHYFLKSIANESPTGGAKATYRPMCKEAAKKKVALRGAVKLEESGPGGAEAAYRSEH